MPTYEYACTECGDRLEAVQSFSDDPLTVCPSCKGRLRKVFSPVGVVFKGSGFYKNDSRSGKSNGASAGSSSEPSKATGGDSSSSGSDSGGSGSGGSDSGGSESGTSTSTDSGGAKADKGGKAGKSDSKGGGSKVA